MRERLTDAAFALFDEYGFDQTTVSDIAERAGVGRTTVFRSFQSKDDLVFPDHDRLLASVEGRLATSSATAMEVAVFEALAIVLRYFISEGERARSRYRLTRSVTSLADREAAAVLRYQRLFFGFFENMLQGQPDASLRAELAASAVVTAHNHVLRRWLRGSTDDAEAALKEALSYAVAALRNPPEEKEHSIVLLRTDRPIEDVLAALQRSLGHDHLDAGDLAINRRKSKR